MSNEEQDRASGSVPNAFGNALAWKWSREMPTALRRGFLTLLYALRAMANASGELRFTSDRQPIRIQDIAKAAGASEKDARRYLDAAIRARVVVVKGERKRGKPTLYVILPTPWPNWQAAEDHLKATARKPGKKPAPWAKDDTGSSGDRDPNQNGSPRPELTDGTDQEVRVTATRMGSGDRDPNGSGHRDPNNPGVHVFTHDGDEVVSQPQVVGPPGLQDQDPHDSDSTADDDTSGWTLCARCNDPMLPRFGRTTHAHCQPLADAERSA